MGFEQLHKPASPAGTIQRKPAPSLIQRKPAAAENSTGLPSLLKSGVERLSGFSMEDVRVHWNSPEPARFQAHAYARGTDIHLAQGQEQHLPHEAWHVVQQKQGRVGPESVQAHGAPVNDDPGLEQEADRMGALALRGDHHGQPASDNRTPFSGASQPGVMQRKKITTDFGDFETTKFAEADGRGVDIELKFHPNEAKVDATKIAFSQSLKKTAASGQAYAIDPNQATKMVDTGKSAAGYAIDQLSELNTPIYTEDVNLGATKELKDTVQSADKRVGEMGYCFKEKPTDAAKKKHSAVLLDTPKGGKNKGEGKMFESTAFAIDGADSGTYYGSVTWGYTMEGTTAAPTVTKYDISLASKGTPTSNFIEAAKLWNAGKTRGTVEVTADPEATVLKGDASGTEKLAKGSKLKQLSTVMWGSSPSIKAEVLKADGTGSGKIVFVKNSDVKDKGDGADTKDLPIPK